MPRNLVILIDGTGQAFQTNETNVVRLTRMLSPDTVAQPFYYAPGVGSRAAPSLDPFAGEGRALASGLALGAGIYERVGDAYRWLAHNWRDGDRIFLFGFSRGAFAVRALAGVIARIGLIDPGADNLIPFAIKLYADIPLGRGNPAAPAHAALLARFGETFGCRHPDIHFVGLWDTVKSVLNVELFGGRPIGVSLAGTYANPKVHTVRHAIAIDERRAFFRTNRWRAAAPGGGGTDVREVWFAGCHGDVGGGVPNTESGLSAISLQWLAGEAEAAELAIDPARRDALYAATPPDVRQPVHESLAGFWKLLEYLPANPRRGPDSAERAGWSIPNGHRRRIADGAILHQSVLDKIAAGVGYAPSNLPGSYTVEPWRPAPVSPAAP